MKNSAIIVAFSLALGIGSVSAQEGAATANVNIGHLAPFAPTVGDTAVSIDVDGTEQFNPVLYKQFTGYTALSGAASPFDVDVDVRLPPGGSAAISETLTLENGFDYTVVAIGDGTNQPIELLTLVDSQPLRGTVPAALLRIVHAAPFAADPVDTEVDIRTDSGDVVNGLTNVPYKGESGFFPLPADTYDLQVTTPGGATALIDLAPVTLNAGDVVTVFAIGDIANQPVGAVAFFDDGTVVELPLELDIPEASAVPTLGWIGIALMALLLGGIGIRRMI